MTNIVTLPLNDDNAVEDSETTVEEAVEDTLDDTADFGDAVRPDAPAHLTAEQKAVWDTIVSVLPATWFPPETHESLVHYCQHVVSAKKLSEGINDFEKAPDWANDIWMKSYAKLLSLREAETRAASSYATRLRFTSQSTRSSHAKRDAEPTYTFE